MDTPEIESAGTVEPPPAPPPVTWIDRLQAAFEVLLVAGLLSSLLAALPFSFNPNLRARLMTDASLTISFILIEAFLTMGFLMLVLRAHRQRIRDLGLASPGWRGDVILGVAVVPLLFLLNLTIAILFKLILPQYFLERNPLTELIRTPRDLMLFLFAALMAGGFKEEFQRAFILRRFERYLGGAWLGLLLWSVVFGLGHYVQGAQGVTAAAVFGLLFGCLYLIRGNLIAPIVAHALYDTAALLGYWFLSPRS
jgi:membrane protease YdiL (CAAX protease family)